MDNAMKEYRAARNSYPPCFQAAGNSSATAQQVRMELMLGHLRRAYPRCSARAAYQSPTGLRNYIALQVSGRDVLTLDAGEALVFWLGGLSAPPGTGSTKLLGFCADVTDPLNFTNPQRTKGTFPFAEDRLTDQDQDGWYEYVPQTTSSGDSTPPYVYFDGPVYVKSGTNPALWTFVPYSMTTRPDYGTLLPYATSATASTVNWIEPRGYQIISAGLDDNYGQSGQIKFHPSGIPYELYDEDNLTSFINKPLGSAVE
jgi:hypothetical protein